MNKTILTAIFFAFTSFNTYASLITVTARGTVRELAWDYDLNSLTAGSSVEYVFSFDRDLAGTRAGGTLVDDANHDYFQANLEGGYLLPVSNLSATESYNSAYTSGAAADFMVGTNNQYVNIRGNDLPSWQVGTQLWAYEYLGYSAEYRDPYGNVDTYDDWQYVISNLTVTNISDASLNSDPNTDPDQPNASNVPESSIVLTMLTGLISLGAFGFYKKK